MCCVSELYYKQYVPFRRLRASVDSLREPMNFNWDILKIITIGIQVTTH
jgi:hypothetical protein